MPGRRDGQPREDGPVSLGPVRVDTATPVSAAKGRYNQSAVNLETDDLRPVAIATATVGGRTLTKVSMYGLIHDGYADSGAKQVLERAAAVEPAVDPLVRGHGKVPAAGRLRSPLVAMKSPHLASVVSAGG